MKKSTRGLTPVIRLCSLFQGRVHAGTLYLYSSKLSTLSTFVKIYLRTLVKNTVNCQHSQLLLNCQHSQLMVHSQHSQLLLNSQHCQHI